MAFLEKIDTGQTHISIVKFDKRRNYYLYIYDPTTRKVGYASLGSTDLEWVKNNWFKTYSEYVRKGGSSIRQKRTTLKAVLKKYIDYQYGRADRGEIKDRTARTFHERVRNNIRPFIDQSGLQTVQEINKRSFKDFCRYWTIKGKDATTINSCATTFNHFLKWLSEDMDLLDRNNIPILKKQQVVKDYKKSANPAFSGKDWEIFKETLNRYEYLNEGWTDDMEEKEKWWFRRAFVCWVKFQFHSGNRPHETSLLKWGDVNYSEYELKNGGKTLRGIITIARDTKRGARTSVMNGWYIKRIMDHFHAFKHRRWLAVETNDETPLFLNPYTGKTLHSETYRHHFKNVLRLSGLEDKGYTPYSLRSTHITYQLLSGVHVIDIARNLGTSIEMINRHYDGVQNIMKSDDLMKLNKHYYDDREKILD